MKYWYVLSSMLCVSSAALMADQATDTNAAPVYQPEGVTSQPKGVITPPVAPRVDHGADVFINADFIWWKAQVAGQEYVDLGAHRKEAPFKFEPGLKVGLGLDLEHDGWDVYAQYTWLNGPKQHSSTSSSTGGNSTVAFPAYVAFPDDELDPSVITAPATYASSHKKFTFNVLDLELGRNFFISKRLTLRPNFGLKFGWLTDKVDNTYTYSTETTFFNDYNQTKINRKQDTFGVGIRAGINTVWHFARSWGIYGDLNVTTLWGSFDNKSNVHVYDETSTGSGEYTLINSQSRKENSQDIIPVVEAGLGLTYMTWFYDESYMFSLKAGWEEQIWVNYNHMINLPSNNTGNLSLHGLTLRAEFAF